jgi:hypothetical protein
MPRTYDLEQERQSFDSFGLAFLRAACQKIPEYRGNAASGNMSFIVTAWLLGREADVREPLATSLQWFDHARSVDEQFGESPHFEAAHRNEAHGLALWLANGVSSKLPYQTAVRHFEHHFESEGKKARRGPPKFDYAAQRYEDPEIRGIPFEPEDILNGSLDDYLASCLQCGEFTRGAALYEKVGGKTGIADSKIQHAIHFGYWLCKSGRDGSISAQQCGAIGARVLRASLRERWLGRGQNVRAATWLKIVAEFAQWNLSPHGVMQRARQFFLSPAT